MIRFYNVDHQFDEYFFHTNNYIFSFENAYYLRLMAKQLGHLIL